MIPEHFSEQRKAMIFPRSALRAGLILSLFITASVARANEKCCEETSVLDMRIEGLKLDNVTMEQALIALVDKHRSQLLIGFEEIPHVPQAEPKRISLRTDSGTVREILDRLCRADPRYEFKAVNKELIHVYPKGRASDPHGLMDIMVRDFTFRGNVFPQTLIGTINKHAPELRQFLDTKRKLWLEKSGKTGGAAGSLMTGNATPPEVEIKLNDVTVRGVLNAIALYGRKLYLEGHTKGLEPAGWKYEFIIDTNSPTGLGGYPKWSAF